ncbi:hypothetical protein M433DRAFT_28463, partial [Acidomyces richmondensis BFW]
QKPDPLGQPLVWADSRQALCETVPYFKKPQGGCHQNDRHVYAFLFDGVGHCREYMDNDVIIARAGGSMEPDGSGTMIQAKHQSMSDAQVQAVMNDIELQNPLIIICGDKNTASPSKIPHKYCVLGWYKPILIWAEKTAGRGGKSWTTVKFRFERLQPEKPAWHAPKNMGGQRQYQMSPARKNVCGKCHKTSPQVYLLFWSCLNPQCELFWKLASGVDAPSGTLDYDPAFLLARNPWPNEEEPFNVKPPLPDIGNAIGDNLSYINTRGICCPECGRCYKVYKYTFDGIEGNFVHAIANNKINREPRAADEMLIAMQTEDMRLQRRSDSNLQTKGSEIESGDFMTAFSVNYGMPYKFVSSVASLPFEEAPWPVTECRSRLNWAARTFLDDRTLDADFNEALILAYMEGQKMEYHDDGEEGLGPRIATLSLGGKAKMHVRMKMKHYTGCSKSGIFTPERPVPGGIGGKDMDKRRLAEWEKLQTLKEVDRAAYQARLKEIPRELGLFEKRMKKADDLVTVSLSHGDIILMEGYDIQKYLEHKVVAKGYLRFALTCRTVLANHLKPEELPKYEVRPDSHYYQG